MGKDDGAVICERRVGAHVVAVDMGIDNKIGRPARQFLDGRYEVCSNRSHAVIDEQYVLFTDEQSHC